jgi:hypothetical protein
MPEKRSYTRSRTLAPLQHQPDSEHVSFRLQANRAQMWYALKLKK